MKIRRGVSVPFARFLASCAGVRLATPLDPGTPVRRFLVRWSWEMSEALSLALGSELVESGDWPS